MTKNDLIQKIFEKFLDEELNISSNYVDFNNYKSVFFETLEEVLNEYIIIQGELLEWESQKKK